uniref:Uncharacterized protein n=1 Tax=Caenorhabditis japonica TaxID=281687 RepID=A0A8R1IKW8_CAEJA
MYFHRDSQSNPIQQERVFCFALLVFFAPFLFSHRSSMLVRAKRIRLTARRLQARVSEAVFIFIFISPPPPKKKRKKKKKKKKQSPFTISDYACERSGIASKSTPHIYEHQIEIRYFCLKRNSFQVN